MGKPIDLENFLQTLDPVLNGNSLLPLLGPIILLDKVLFTVKIHTVIIKIIPRIIRIIRSFALCPKFMLRFSNILYFVEFQSSNVAP